MAVWWKQSDAYEAIERQGSAVDIGQIGPEGRRTLDRLAKQGVVVKYRGHWDTLLASMGMGPLKTIWAIPEIAKQAADFDAAMQRRAA